MLGTSLVLLALAATGLAQAPAGYSTVYLTSNVNTSFVIQPKTATIGSAVVVFVLNVDCAIRDANTK